MGRSGIPNGQDFQKNIILNDDKSMMVSTNDMGQDTYCYSPYFQTKVGIINSTLVQGVANGALFRQINTTLNSINWASCKPKWVAMGGFDDVSYVKYVFCFLQNGTITHTISMNQYELNDKLKNLVRLFERLDETMCITKPHPFLSIEGIDLFYLRFGNYTFTANNSSAETDTPQEIRLLNTEAYLLWNYLRKAKIIDGNLATKQLPYKYDYHSIGICKNDTLLNANLKINNKWENVKKGETDGRHFRFIADSGTVITLDIGFNFFTHTMRNYIRERVLKID